MDRDVELLVANGASETELLALVNSPWRADASHTAGVYNTKRQAAVRAASAELWDSTGQDHVHPNEAGARAIARQIWPYLQPLLKQAA